MAHVYTVYSPHKVESVVLTPTSGGVLEPNTTYYFKCSRWNTSRQTNGTRLGTSYSELSDEVSFTTTTTDLSVQVDWDMRGVSSEYIAMFLTTIPGDYANTKSWNTPEGSYGSEGIHAVSSGYIIATSVNTYNNYATHLFQLSSIDKIHGVDKEARNIQVKIQGTGDLTFKEIYDEVNVIAPGSVYYEPGGKFTINGSLDIQIDGTLLTFDENIYFIKGVLSIYGSTAKFQAGYPYYKNVGNHFSSFYFATYRYAFYSGSSTSTDVNGGTWDTQSIYYTIFNNALYRGGLNFGKMVTPSYTQISGNITGFEPDILRIGFRANSGLIKNLTFYQNNNFGSYGVVDSFMMNTAWLPYSEPSYKQNAFYRSEFLSTSRPTFYENHTYNNYMYDVIGFRDPTRWYNPGEVLTRIGKLYINFSISLDVLDLDKNPLDGVKIEIFNNNGIAEWESKSSDSLKLAINEHGTEFLTDASGKFDKYVITRLFERGDWYSTSNYHPIITEFSNWRVEISKSGYISQVINIGDLTEAFNTLVFLEDDVKTKLSVDGELLIITNPEKGIKSNILKL